MSKREEHTSEKSTAGGTRSHPGHIIISFVTIILLAITLVGTGLFVCTANITTEILSESFSRWEGSGFSKEQVVEAAVAVKDYTVDGNDKDKLIAELESIFGLTISPTLLDQEVLEHLEDVFLVVDTARSVIIVIVAITLCFCFLIGFSAGSALLGTTLRFASLLVVVPLMLIAIWCIVDFNGFFTVLHSLFFAEGTWLFDANSLLIRMYPTPFWIGMGVVWLCTTLVCCLICFILGRKIQGKKRL